MPGSNSDRAEIARYLVNYYLAHADPNEALALFRRLRGPLVGGLDIDGLYVELLSCLQHLERHAPGMHTAETEALCRAMQQHFGLQRTAAAQRRAAARFADQTLEDDVQVALQGQTNWSLSSIESPEGPWSVAVLFEGEAAWRDGSEALLSLLEAGFTADHVHATRRFDPDGWLAFEVRRKEQATATDSAPIDPADEARVATTEAGGHIHF